MRVTRRLTPTLEAAAAAGILVLSVGGSASAKPASASWNLPGGDTFQVNAWHCGAYRTACSWNASVKLLGYHPTTARWIKNRSELRAHGIRASLTISKNPSATLTMKSRSLGVASLRNTHAWIADTSGVMSPSWSTAYVSVRSCGTASVNSNITVSEKCVYHGAF